MKRILTLSCVLVLGLAEPAAAQPGFFPRPSPYQSTAFQPPLSSYLNLRRGANTPGLNYFLGVLPDQERRTLANQLFTPDFGVVQRPDLFAETGDVLPELPATGHPVRFLTYGSYYNLGPQGQRGTGLLSPTFRPQPRR
ncbi:MAG: hypothetical protein L0Z62_29155 [Gemmataceae bacterium]|nr:hypothetical protein [Gemmataceae bacterium]